MVTQVTTDDKNLRKQGLLKKLKNTRWQAYKQWPSCYCEALQTTVHFTPDGFFHLQSDPSGRARTISEQLHKYTLLTFVPEIIKNCDSVSSYIKKKAPVSRKRKGGKLLIKEFEYWALETSLPNNPKKKIRVIVRKLVGSEKVIFWSIM